jgi:hypothetical protein
MMVAYLAFKKINILIIHGIGIEKVNDICKSGYPVSQLLEWPAKAKSRSGKLTLFFTRY